MVLSELTLEFLVAGIAGGMLGATIGALPALGLAGLVITIGEFGRIGADSMDLFGGAGISPAPIDVGSVGAAIGVGSLLGPHVAFAGGVAAAAYVGRHETYDTTFRYHQAKNIVKPLGSAPDVLIVGGVFGLLGVLIARLAAGAALPLDPIALAVVLSALAHRVAFGYPLVGRLRDRDHGILDMTPYEQDMRWGESPYDADHGVGGRQVVEVWLPSHYRLPNVAVLGAAVGVAAGYIAIVSNSPLLAFGLAAFAVLFYAMGLYSVPIVYHMALPAGIVALALDISVPVLADPVAALLFAGVVGVVAALLGELAQRVFYAHGDTHVDPPMVAILLTSLLITALVAAGVLDGTAVPYPSP